MFNITFSHNISNFPTSKTAHAWSMTKLKKAVTVVHDSVYIGIKGTLSIRSKAQLKVHFHHLL